MYTSQIIHTVCVLRHCDFPWSYFTVHCSRPCFSSVLRDSFESPDELLWQFVVAQAELYLSPSSHPQAHTIIKHISPPPPSDDGKFPGSYFKVQVLKAATWRKTRRHVLHKRMNLWQLNSAQGGGCYMCVRVCPFPWQQGWKHELPCTVSPYKGAAGPSPAQQYL